MPQVNGVYRVIYRIDDAVHVVSVAGVGHCADVNGGDHPQRCGGELTRSMSAPSPRRFSTNRG